MGRGMGASIIGLYASLKSVPWIDPWLDEENLLPGQDWNMKISQWMFTELLFGREELVG